MLMHGEQTIRTAYRGILSGFKLIFKKWAHGKQKNWMTILIAPELQVKHSCENPKSKLVQIPCFVPFDFSFFSSFQRPEVSQDHSFDSFYILRKQKANRPTVSWFESSVILSTVTYRRLHSSSHRILLYSYCNVLISKGLLQYSFFPFPQLCRSLEHFWPQTLSAWLKWPTIKTLTRTHLANTFSPGSVLTR